MRQRAGTFQVVPTRPVNPAHFSRHKFFQTDRSLIPNIEMNKERFHNQLALNLGYQHIVKDMHINLNIDERQYADDVMISISIDGLSKPICYKASEGLSQIDMDCLDENGYEDIKLIVDAVLQAYIDANRMF